MTQRDSRPSLLQVTGILHFFNKTPINWFSKLQSTVDTATFGSEYVAARTCTEQIIDLRMTLRYLRRSPGRGPQLHARRQQDRRRHPQPTLMESYRSATTLCLSTVPAMPSRPASHGSTTSVVTPTQLISSANTGNTVLSSPC